MNEQLKQELAEFEALVDEVKGDCDRCTQDCRRRLQWLDSIVEALRQERKAFAKEREAFRAEREQLAALYQINLRVLNLVNAPASKTGERDNETDFITRFTL